MADNPLLDLPFAVPFDRIRAEHVEPAVATLLAEARARLDTLGASPGPRTFANTMEPLDELTEPLDCAVAVIDHLESVATTPELRAAHEAIQEPVAAFHSSLTLSPALWTVLQAYAATPEARALTGERKRFLESTLADFRREGAELDAAGKERLAALDAELAAKTTTYAQHVLDATNAFEWIATDRAQLPGLPASAVDAARASAEARGIDGWRFTLQEPSYVAILTHLDDASVRARFYRAQTTRASGGPFDNRPIVARILELRRERARLLGFASFADLVLDDRMAKNGATALRFVEELRARTAARFAEENTELQQFRCEIEGPDAPLLAPWDVGYYAEKERRARYDIDDEALRPYFPFEAALGGLFTLVERLYGIRIEPITSLPVWHPSVRTYAVRDADGSELGAFYADFFPREAKRGGAWMHGLVTGVPGAEPRAPHLALICGNVTPPVGDAPALLTHGEVETLFHEFGHLLHHMFSRVPIRGLAATNVAWDFVELPSQIMENWCWERDALGLFARHHVTGAPLPDVLFDRMVRARNYRSANAMMRQLGFARVDLALHVEYDPARDGDAVAYARRILQEYSGFPLPEDHALITSFGHLFANPVGYGAGYYSYKWAEVLDADAFGRFKREGVLSPEVGRAFRESILARGDGADPLELYRAFMGRDPDVEALLARSGLVTAA